MGRARAGRIVQEITPFLKRSEERSAHRTEHEGGVIATDAEMPYIVYILALSTPYLLCFETVWCG